MSPDTITRILSALRSRKAPTRVIAIDGDDHTFVFRPGSDAIQALLDAKGRKQATRVGDRHTGAELFSRHGFGLIKQDCIPVNSKTIGWDTCRSVIGPVILSGADNAESGLVDRAKTWFEENRENETAVMSALIFMVSAVSASNTTAL